MQNIKRILIVVDDSINSELIVREGIFLTKLLGIKAKIITVNDTYQFISSVVIEERLKKEAIAFMDDFIKIGEDLGVKIEAQLLVGKPAEEIVKFAKEDDLIIMAHHDRTKGINKFMESSVSRDVVRDANCSVLVVKSKETSS